MGAPACGCESEILCVHVTSCFCPCENGACPCERSCSSHRFEEFVPAMNLGCHGGSWCTKFQRHQRWVLGGAYNQSECLNIWRGMDSSAREAYKTEFMNWISELGDDAQTSGGGEAADNAEASGGGEVANDAETSVQTSGGGEAASNAGTSGGGEVANVGNASDELDEGKVRAAFERFWEEGEDKLRHQQQVAAGVVDVAKIDASAEKAQPTAAAQAKDSCCRT